MGTLSDAFNSDEKNFSGFKSINLHLSKNPMFSKSPSSLANFIASSGFITFGSGFGSSAAGEGTTFEKAFLTVSSLIPALISFWEINWSSNPLALISRIYSSTVAMQGKDVLVY